MGGQRWRCQSSSQVSDWQCSVYTLVVMALELD